MALKCENRTDRDGNPAGGYAEGPGIDIKWQDGSSQNERNGAQVDDLIRISIQRLDFLQGSCFNCPEYARAIACLQDALGWCEKPAGNRSRGGDEATASTETNSQEVWK